MPKPKYDYFSDNSKRTTDVDAPDFRDADEWGSLLLAVTGVTLLFVGEVSTRQIKEQFCGHMPKGRERQRFESRIADALGTLVSGRILEEYGIRWIRYRKATPVEKVEVVIDSERANAYKAYQREQNGRYPTYALNF